MNLAASSATTSATARRPEQLDDLVAEYGDRILPLRLDVTDADAAAGSGA